MLPFRMDARYTMLIEHTHGQEGEYKRTRNANVAV